MTVSHSQGRYSNIFISRLEPFFGVQNFEFQYFFQKCDFLGYEEKVEFFIFFWGGGGGGGAGGGVITKLDYFVGGSFLYILGILSSPEPKAQGELIVWDSSRRRSVRPSTLSNMNFSETSWQIIIKFHQEHHWGVGLTALGFG